MLIREVIENLKKSFLCVFRNREPRFQLYKLECGTCDKMYIGQTGRTFRERIEEHFRRYFNQDDASNYANHLIDFNHRFNNKYSILHQENKGAKLNLLETIEIYRLKCHNILLNN